MINPLARSIALSGGEGVSFLMRIRSAAPASKVRDARQNSPPAEAQAVGINHSSEVISPLSLTDILITS